MALDPGHRHAGLSDKDAIGDMSFAYSLRNMRMLTARCKGSSYHNGLVLNTRIGVIPPPKFRTLLNTIEALLSSI